MWGKMASCGRLAIGLSDWRPVSLALCAINVDENLHRPDTIRPQDAVLPHNGGLHFHAMHPQDSERRSGICDTVSDWER
jgi:hypothetical protein